MDVSCYAKKMIRAEINIKQNLASHSRMSSNIIYIDQCTTHNEIRTNRPKRNTMEPVILFSHHMLRKRILFLNRLAMVESTNHQRMAPPAMPDESSDISTMVILSLATLMAAMMARNKKMAMGLEMVSRKTDTKSCESCDLFILWSFNCLTGLV